MHINFKLGGVGGNNIMYAGLSGELNHISSASKDLFFWVVVEVKYYVRIVPLWWISNIF